jgi:hypothetical protein
VVAGGRIQIFQCDAVNSLTRIHDIMIILVVCVCVLLVEIKVPTPKLSDFIMFRSMPVICGATTCRNPSSSAKFLAPGKISCTCLVFQLDNCLGCLDVSVSLFLAFIFLLPSLKDLILLQRFILLVSASELYTQSK